MTDENFLGRWSRRKEAAREGTGTSAELQNQEQERSPAQEEPEAETAEFEPSTLPSIESLDGASDYTVFLKAEVPKALRQAALRRAWSSNAAITGHKPLVDYDWNFHAPGYGKLWPVDDPARFIAGLFARAHALGREASSDEAGPEAGDPAGGVEAVTPFLPASPEPPGAEIERLADKRKSVPDDPVS